MGYFAKSIGKMVCRCKVVNGFLIKLKPHIETRYKSNLILKGLLLHLFNTLFKLMLMFIFYVAVCTFISIFL